MKQRHSTDEEMLAQIYGLRPASPHLDACPECAGRLAAMLASRNRAEAAHCPADEIGAAFLAAQRRAVYARLDRPRWFGFQSLLLRRWAPACAMVAVLAGGALVFEQRQAALASHVSDAQLFTEVGQLAEDPTPDAVAPIEGMFE